MPEVAVQGPESGRPTADSRWRQLWAGFAGVAGAVALLAAFSGNVASALGALGDLTRPVVERGVAAWLSMEPVAASWGHALMSDEFDTARVCIVGVRPMDMRGQGRLSDLAVIFVRYETAGPCPRDDDGSSRDIAFFRNAWVGYRFLGTPPLAEDVSVWKVVGPAAFQEVADSAFPTLRVFMLRDDDRMSLIGHVDTVSPDGYSATSYLPIENGGAVLVSNMAGLSRVGFDAAGMPGIVPFTAGQVQSLGRGLHLLSHSPEGDFSFDGRREALRRVEPGDDSGSPPAGPRAGDVFVARIPAGDRVYAIGCRPGHGVQPDPRTPGAFALSLAAGPFFVCPLGEASRFRVRFEALTPR